MPINVPNEAYQKTKPQVTRVRDCADGPDAVKAKGETYLPKLGGQSDSDYNAYKLRGYIMPVVNATATALTGAIMRKDPTPTLPTKLEYLIDNSNEHGRDLSMVATMTVNELFLAGRHGLLAEPTDFGVSILTYVRESIINWSEDYIVLSQQYMVTDKDDKFKQIEKTEYLELTFDENGQYIQNIWREGNGKKWGIHETLAPTISGVRLTKLPFEFINTKDATSKLTPPALLPLADVNLDQYRLSTDLRHGLHWTALPTLFLFGDIKDDKGKQVSITVGAGSSNHINDDEARAELLEFTGAGLHSIDVAIKEDIDTMASIGARMLQGTSPGVKAAETARIEQSGESATLSTIAQATENGITSLLRTIADWSGLASKDIKYELNKDFIDSSLTPQEVTAYLQAYQTEAISLDTFLNLLHRGELLPKGVSPEQEAERIDAGRDFNDE